MVPNWFLQNRTVSCAIWMPRYMDAAFVQQILDGSQRQRVANVHHHLQADDLKRGPEVAENADNAHPVRLAARGKPIFF